MSDDIIGGVIIAFITPGENLLFTGSLADLVKFRNKILEFKILVQWNARNDCSRFWTHYSYYYSTVNCVNLPVVTDVESGNS